MFNKILDSIMIAVMVGAFALMFAVLGALQYAMGQTFAACLTGFVALGALGFGVMLAFDTHK